MKDQSKIEAIIADQKRILVRTGKVCSSTHVRPSKNIIPPPSR